MTDISGDFNLGTPITCVLNEGAPTVTLNTYTPGGLKVKGHTWASELHKGEVVAIDPSTGNTYAATGGLPVVKPIANADATIFGIIETEPEQAAVIPDSASADTLDERLAGEYYRIATVRIISFTAIIPVTLKTADVAAVVPGEAGTLKVDVSESLGSGAGFVVNDVASGGTGLVPLHYQAKAAGAEVEMLCGITGLLTGAT